MMKSTVDTSTALCLEIEKWTHKCFKEFNKVGLRGRKYKIKTAWDEREQTLWSLFFYQFDLRCFLTIFAAVLRVPSELPLNPSHLCIKSLHYLHNLILRTSSSSPSSSSFLLLCSVKLDFRIKPPFLQEHCASLSALNLLTRTPSTCGLRGEPNTLHHLWHLVLERNLVLVSLSLAFLPGGLSETPSRPVSEDLRCGWDDRFNWSWGFDTRWLWRATPPFRQITPHHQTSSGVRCGRLVAGSWRTLTAGEEIADANHDPWAAARQLFFRFTRGKTWRIMSNWLVW